MNREHCLCWTKACSGHDDCECACDICEPQRQEGPPKGAKGADRYAVRVEIRMRGEVAA